MRTYPVRPLWQQILLIAAFAVGCVLAAAAIVLTLVAFSPAWGPM